MRAGRLLAQSTGFASPQEAGRAVAQLKRDGLAGLEESLRLAEGVSQADLAAALGALTEALTDGMLMTTLKQD